MKQIIKIENFLNAISNIWESPMYTDESQAHNITYWSDFGDYPDLTDFEAEIISLNYSDLSKAKIKTIDEKCIKLIDIYNEIISNFYKPNDNITIGKLQTRITINPETIIKGDEVIRSFTSYVSVKNENNSKYKQLHFDNNDLIKDIRKIKSIIENIQLQPESDFDTIDKQKLKGENMNLDLFDSLFVPQMTRGANPTKLDLLKKDLRANVCIYKGKQITALADVIFKSGMLHKYTKPKTFTDWLKQFCIIIDYPLPTYKQQQVKNEFDTLKNTYYYLIP